MLLKSSIASFDCVRLRDGLRYFPSLILIIPGPPRWAKSRARASNPFGSLGHVIKIYHRQATCLNLNKGRWGFGWRFTLPRNFLLLSGILTRLTRPRRRFGRIVPRVAEERAWTAIKKKKEGNYVSNAYTRVLAGKKSSLKFAAQKYVPVVRKRWILAVDGRPPREYRGMKYDYWICQKQLCHGHLLAGREIKLHEIVTFGIIRKAYNDLTSLYFLIDSESQNVYLKTESYKKRVISEFR